MPTPTPLPGSYVARLLALASHASLVAAHAAGMLSKHDVPYLGLAFLLAVVLAAVAFAQSWRAVRAGAGARARLDLVLATVAGTWSGPMFLVDARRLLLHLGS